MVFSTLVDMIMPDNSMKKYTKMVLGLLVMIIILQPILKFLKKDISLSSYSFKYQNQIEGDYLKNKSSEYNLQQSEEITKQYKLNVQSQMEQQLRRVTGNDNIKVNVDVNDDINSKTYAEIKKVWISVTNDNSIKKIQKVDIGKDGDTVVDSISENKNSMDLKDMVVSMYGIQPDMVEIRMEE